MGVLEIRTLVYEKILDKKESCSYTIGESFYINFLRAQKLKALFQDKKYIYQEIEKEKHFFFNKMLLTVNPRKIKNNNEKCNNLYKPDII